MMKRLSEAGKRHSPGCVCKKSKTDYSGLPGDSRGEGALKTVIAVLLLAMLLSGIVFYAQIFNTVKDLENRMRIVLDSCLMRESLVIYGSLDDGHDDSVVPSREIFGKAFDGQFPNLRDAASGASAELYAASIEENHLNYGMTEPELSCSVDGHLKLYASFTVVYPVYFAGTKLFDARIPVTVESRYISMYS